ncbi:CYTH and CHAD domain-containing protein [Psychrobacter halodurans]|uniref:CYTH and CHAD domain-containing protein n=1 Tax=Psychrobacter halodurans TaxID=2818439 RepID=A0AAW4ILJ5_9GAMM|nr:CYTH and CHAD domain-containing protein [Psychrobacter halodurans]MBO1516352.1 CYTH and CHAD domain-containing protein [Psychrobacter halodurans]
MQEIELKFLVPESRLKGLMRQAKVKSSQTTQMAAHYYDTPDQQLAQAGIGLRIRKEDDTWVQTIKAGGDGLAARLEHNATLDPEHVQAMLADKALMPDFSIYKDTAIAPALAPFKLKKLTKNLTQLYVTDVERTTRLLIEDNDEDADNQLEMAYDYGEIVHGNDDALRDCIQEIEFELVSGDIDFLFTTAKVWCKRYKLCLSTITKAERGGLLITGQAHSPAVTADTQLSHIDNHTSMPAFIRAAVHHCLLHMLPNSSAIVSGRYDDAHVLQLAIGITRLHAALQAFASFSDEINPEWSPILEQTQALLSDYQHLTHLASTVEPYLQQYGAPAVEWAADIDAIKIRPMDAVCANDFQLTLLELIAFAMSDPALEPHADKSAKEALTAVLLKQQKAFVQAEERLQHKRSPCLDGAESEENATDDTKKNGGAQEMKDAQDTQESQQALLALNQQVTTLYYVHEFATPLLKTGHKKKKAKKKLKRQRKHLLKAKQVLSHYDDAMRYGQHYQQKSATETRALFGAGWFAATLKTQHKPLQKRLAKVKKSLISI